MLQPRYHLEPGNSEHLLALATFIIVSAVVGALYETARAAQHRAERALEREAEARSELQTLSENLRAANSAKDDFLGLVSHELKTPVTTIMLDAGLIQRPSLGPEQSRELLDDIGAEAERLGRIIDNLLSLARIERGISAPTEPLMIDGVLRSVVSSHQRRFPDRAISVSVERSLIACGNPLQLEQVLENLLSNAEKYSSPGRRIDIIARAENGEVVVSVLDRGNGIDGDEAGRIFSPFYRSPATARSVSGVGVGLAVCKRLVEAQSGRIWVTSRPAGGSDFSFTLPLAEEVDTVGVP